MQRRTHAPSFRQDLAHAVPAALLAGATTAGWLFRQGYGAGEKASAIVLFAAFSGGSAVMAARAFAGLVGALRPALRQPSLLVGALLAYPVFLDLMVASWTYFRIDTEHQPIWRLMGLLEFLFTMASIHFVAAVMAPALFWPSWAAVGLAVLLTDYARCARPGHRLLPRFDRGGAVG